MKREFIYERRQTASRWEAIMVAVSGISVVAAIFALLSYGWLPGVAMLILSAIAFALSRVFDLLGDLFASMNRPDESARPRAAESETKT